ncbi:1,4-dihydroxy-6-naphthoate synthase [Dactylosporangium vinaceum]|uniref:1,4-dihydroxy-6-naphtoate synthase n=1 Tax=Dactylosporangium vinaceum TaxID=53362 RepID=A0ABV5MK35_9ACTN|nr:1,4-dihydroxy-6-naphthoate synthase [Dactylosporangium vinaceum]UAB92777.1 1,4-dihydroxy-6-naphthoate synthase [Dactylosporangium vinaceum]
MDEALRVAYSPCPNDTFVFHAWTHGRLPGAPATAVTHADIDVTNGLAGSDRFDVLKISYAALPLFLDRFALVPCGGALGRGCGPLLLTRPGTGLDALPDATVAVPSERSTAYLLLRLWAASAVPGGLGRVVVLPFHEIMPAVRDGAVDAGLIIHESRFTYPQYGLQQLVDLGQFWERDTSLPIPLGAIVARRDLGAPALTALAATIRASVEHAWRHPDDSSAYVREHAQEMAPEVMAQHIGLYVNSFTADLGAEGLAAVRALLDRAAAVGACPAVPPGALDFPATLSEVHPS